MIYDMLFYISLGAAAALAAADIYYSRTDIYYGLTEANHLWADRYGYFAPTRAIISTIVIFVGLSLLKFIPAIGNQAAIVFAIIAVGTAIILQRKFKNRSAARKRQAEVLYAVRNHSDHDIIQIAFRIADDRLLLVWFPWIYTEAGNIEAATQELSARLIELAKRPSDEWFPA
jgi:hypothetical protein